MASALTKQQPWYQGHSGATNFTRGEAQKFARQLVTSEGYRDKLQKDMNDRTIQPQIEAMLWYYAFGKPIEQVNVTVSAGQEDLSTLTIAELQERAKTIADQLEEAQALDAAIPVEFKTA